MKIGIQSLNIKSMEYVLKFSLKEDRMRVKDIKLRSNLAKVKFSLIVDVETDHIIQANGLIEIYKPSSEGIFTKDEVEKLMLEKKGKNLSSIIAAVTSILYNNQVELK